jgi:hypothetical protein
MPKRRPRVAVIRLRRHDLDDTSHAFAAAHQHGHRDRMDDDSIGASVDHDRAAAADGNSD